MSELSLPSLTLVTGRHLYRPPEKAEGRKAADPLSIIEAAIAGGVDTVQLRARADAEDMGLFAVALRLRELTAGKARFILTGDIELAERVRADGVLLAERSYRPSEARGFLRDEAGGRLVGVFVHGVSGAGAAERGGADYVQIGPAFPPAGAEPPEEGSDGLALVRKVKDAVNIPVFAFGGITTPEQAVACLAAGADGVAVTEAIARAPDPQAAAAAFRAALDAARAG